MNIKKYLNKKLILLIYLLIILLLIESCTTKPSNYYTKEIGKYPGKASEDFAPTLFIDKLNYQNLALNRKAFHSSSYNSNQTAQLITDGIIDTTNPKSFKVKTSEQGFLTPSEKESLFDRHVNTGISLKKQNGWVIVEFNDKNLYKSVDSLILAGNLLLDNKKTKYWKVIFSGSDNGKIWTNIHSLSDTKFSDEPIPWPLSKWSPSNFRLFNVSVKLDQKYRFKYYKFEIEASGVESWKFIDFGLLNHKERLEIGGPYSFTSTWESNGNDQEWVYVDLGAECLIDSIAMHWINPAEIFEIGVSDNANKWTEIKEFSNNINPINNIKIPSKVKGRYVRLLMKKPLNNRSFSLSEFEVYGVGKLIAKPKKQPKINRDENLYLSGGNWKLQRESLVKNNGENISLSGYDDNNWIVATVPGTVLMSYYNVGAIPDPNYADNQFKISDSFFYSDFWYRNEFNIPETYKGKKVYLNFDGINWKAEVFFNGNKIGNIEGAFMRGQFDITDKIVYGKVNALAVRIIKNETPGYATTQTKETPGANGGETGADNPTFQASVGWDWIPTIRGRNIGIWNDVFLSSSNDITISDPFVSYDLPLPDTSEAAINVELSLTNWSNYKVSGNIIGEIGPVSIKYPVQLEANSTKIVKLDTSVIPDLIIKNPKLWWPNGYGVPYLYDIKIKFKTADNVISDIKTFKSGVRELTYIKDQDILKIYINGRRFVSKGGNWGFSESNLRYRAREYDIAVRYHRDMNFNIIRNWVGQIGDKELYESCDKYGIMVWQDFWLAHPLDGPMPNDNELFLLNANDLIRKIRNHPSIALYCGRNEDVPPVVLDTALENLVEKTHKGIHYISSSTGDGVSGGGPWYLLSQERYFKEQARTKLNSELGMPNIVNYESLKQMMPDTALWPQGDMWGIHDFSLNGGQRGNIFNNKMLEAFGTINNGEEWVKLAQFINYNGYRAMFEAQSKNRMGLLIWMSHSAWPSLVWQTYDYYFDPTAAYFGCKKACEPIHILWNAYTDSIEVMNTSYTSGKDLTAILEVINLNGENLYIKEFDFSSSEDSRVVLAKHPYPDGLSDVYFLRLKIIKDNEVIDENLYWRALKDNDFSKIREVNKVDVNISTKKKLNNGIWSLSAVLNNNSNSPALMARVMVVGDKTRKRILPVIYSDNYVTIMPGEEVEIKMELKQEDTRGEKPIVILDGININ